MSSLTLRGLILVLFAVITTSASANTYYIDFSAGSDRNSGLTTSSPWKLSPGMPSFAASYRHTPGDKFVFKGGVTWPATVLPLNIKQSGAAGNPDVYAADQSWYAGAHWTPPIFDGAQKGITLLNINASNLTFTNFRLRNVGLLNTADRFKAVVIVESQNLDFSHNVVDCACWIGVIYGTQSSGTLQNIEIHDNEVSNAGMAIVVSTGAPGSVLNNVQIHDNTIHDLGSKIGDWVHGDGIHVWGGADDTQYVSNLKIYNNLFYGKFARSFSNSGGMTAYIFVEQATTGAFIYNNVASSSDPPDQPAFGALIMIDGHATRGGGHLIANNTIRGTARGSNAAVLLYNSPNTSIKNNIFAGMSEAYIAMDRLTTQGTTIDNNDPWTTNPATLVGEWPDYTKFDWKSWRAAGRDLHGIAKDPLFLSPTDSHLQPASPCKRTGVNLSQFFSTDKDGHPRSPSGPWSIGAYQ
jgi:hypothetical protein